MRQKTKGRLKVLPKRKMPRKKKEETQDELKVEPVGQCLRCGGKKHEPTEDCDANG